MQFGCNGKRFDPAVVLYDYGLTLLILWDYV